MGTPGKRNIKILTLKFFGNLEIQLLGNKEKNVSFTWQN